MILKQGQSTSWERAVVHTAKVFTIVTLVVSVLLAVGFTGAGIPAWLTLPLSLLLAYLVYAGMTRKIRRRRKILARPFPTEWEEILQREVVFFRAL